MFHSGLPIRSLLASVFLLVPVSIAGAHDAKPTPLQPNGWTYPLACCSDFDCREVADTEVIEGPQGYVIKVTGEVIPMTSRKVRPSPDGVFHWCSVAGKKDGRTICLFVPPRGY